MWGEDTWDGMGTGTGVDTIVTELQVSISTNDLIIETESYNFTLQDSSVNSVVSPVDILITLENLEVKVDE